MSDGVDLGEADISAYIERSINHPKLVVLDDFSIGLDVFNRDNSERVQASMDVEQAKVLLRKLLQLFDPDIGSLQKVLHRHSLVAEKIESLVSSSEFKMPDYPGGFYLEKDSDGQWYFARPVNGALHFDKCSLQDLIDLGVKIDDVKRITANVMYRFSFVGELRDS